MIIGLFCGSFLNILIDRLPKGEDVIWGRSHCDYCKKKLRWYELVPIISYVVQYGRCRRCRKHISFQYPTIEFVTGVAYATLFVLYGRSPILFLSSLLLFSAILVIFIADMKYQIIPDSMLVVSIVAVALCAIALGASTFQLINHGISALAAFAFFFFLWIVTKRRGMGLGDAKLAFVLGLFLGFPKIVEAVYFAFLTGACVGVILMLTGKRSLKSRIAFGPFLILGAVLTIMYGERFMELWQKFI